MSRRPTDGWVFVADVFSNSDPGKKYAVERHERTGLYRCDAECLGFRFSKKWDGPQRLCRHVNKVRQVDAKYEPAVPPMRPAPRPAAPARPMRPPLPAPAAASPARFGLAPARRAICLED